MCDLNMTENGNGSFRRITKKDKAVLKNSFAQTVGAAAFQVVASACSPSRCSALSVSSASGIQLGRLALRLYYPTKRRDCQESFCKKSYEKTRFFLLCGRNETENRPPRSVETLRKGESGVFISFQPSAKDQPYTSISPKPEGRLVLHSMRIYRTFALSKVSSKGVETSLQSCPFTLAASV